MAVIGIDLGTTYSAAAHFVNGHPEIINLEGNATLPSVVGLQASGKIAVGMTAKRNQAKAPQSTIVEVKRKMGTTDPVALGGKTFSAQEISAMILKRIKELAEEELGEPVTGAVITCPAYFKDPARSATEQAGQLAGLKVLGIMNEPTAAAYAYGLRHGDDKKENLFIIYDLGGGTFDVTVIKTIAGSLEVIGTGGDPNLGGGDFDDEIVNWILGRLREKYPDFIATLNDENLRALKLRLKVYAEENKKKLCSSTDAEPVVDFSLPSLAIHEGKPISFSERLTRTEFEKMIMPWVEKSRKWVDEAMKVPTEKHHYTLKDVTAILLVGGSTRVPLVQRKLKEWYPDTPSWGEEKGVHPDEIVALGASIRAAELDPESDQAAIRTLVDVTGHTLSVAALDGNTGKEQLSCIIPKETPIPTNAAYEFFSLGNGQSNVRVRVFQGESKDPQSPDVLMIGEFAIEIDPIKDPTPLIIGLDLNSDGILIAHATNRFNGKKVECKLDYKGSAKMNPAELAKKRAQLDQQLKSVLSPGVNPLDGGGQAAAQTTGTTGNARATGGQPFPPFPPAPQAQPPPAAANQDPTAAMNPILRNLYQKALNSFGSVPAERQDALVQIVTEIDAAARQNDQARLTSLLPRLSQLLNGVA